MLSLPLRCGHWPPDWTVRLPLYLCLLGLDAEGWEYVEDRNRGSKPFYITGDWTAQGHNRPGIDSTYAAGQAGKLEQKTGIGLSEFLMPYAAKASNLLRYSLKRRAPALQSTLDGMILISFSYYSELTSLGVNQYGDFHLFMCPEGASLMHKDKNDWLSFLFLIETEPDKGGELEIGGAGVAVAWLLGDVVILDSSNLYHGARHYCGDKEAKSRNISYTKRLLENK